MKVVAGMVAVVAALAGFYGGLRVGQSQATAGGSPTAVKSPALPAKAGAGQAGAAGQAQCSTGGSTASGSITQLTDSSFTVHNPVCNTDVKVTYGSTVAVRKTVSGQAGDIQESQTVTVQGQVQPDGTIKAATVTVNPGGAPGGRGPRG
jgi:hypothetical protein